MTKAFWAAILLVALGTAGQANPYNKIWQAFEMRCLEPFENFRSARVKDLVRVVGRDGAYHLENGAVLVLGEEDDLGTRSCGVEGVGLSKGYREWTALMLQTGRYRESDTPGLWMSHEWAEPRIILQKTPGAIRVVESEIEA